MIRDFVLIVALVLLVLFGLGCKVNPFTWGQPVQPPAPETFFHKITKTPESLTHVAGALEVLSVFGVLIAVGGLALLMFVPAEQHLSFAIAGTGVCLILTALILRVSLWMIPIAAAAAAITALAGAGIYFYRRWHVQPKA
jgi:hypothetical protein